jgi:NADH-quinone oxidoreductase subunit N
MFSLLGIDVMLSANNFLVVYLGLELMSLSLYALVALRRDHADSTEAAMKYFVLGALASGFLLYGLSMMYGATGSLEISEVFKAIGTGQINKSVLCSASSSWSPASASSSARAVPHVGARRLPGRTTAITLLIGGAPEAGGVRDHDPAARRRHVGPRRRVAADADRAVGRPRCCSATSSRSRRATSSACSAYSSIAQMGFMLLGLDADGRQLQHAVGRNGYSSSMFYITTYVLTTLGSLRHGDACCRARASSPSRSTI